jgi:HYR domain-containing protein/carboxypeptidase family protein
MNIPFRSRPGRWQDEGSRPLSNSSLRNKRNRVLALAVFVCALCVIVPTVFLSGPIQKGSTAPVQGKVGASLGLKPTFSQAVAFVETPAVRDLRVEPLSPEAVQKIQSTRLDREKNEENSERVKTVLAGKTSPFTDPAINNSKNPVNSPNAVTPTIANFDGPDADAGAPLYGTRFAPPDTNGAVGPNHFVATTNMGVRIYDKAGNPLVPQFRLSQLLVGVANAGDDDGDPVVIYDPLADRWILSQFNLNVTANSTHQHVAVSKTGDPTGAYFAYDFLMTANRPGDYPHMGVWSDGYYMTTNDFSLPVFSNPFQGAGLYAFERAKMLVGDPTAKVIAFNTNNQHGGMLPTNFQGFTPPPVGTPNLFFEFDADEFGAATDLVRSFAFHADFNTPANSTLTQGPDIPTTPFDARQPAGRANVAQPAPGEGLDSIGDRLMHPVNFRVLPGGVQSYVLNFTVNVSGVNPTSAATYQTGVRWMEMRRNAGTGAVTINQQATYAPGSGNPTGRDIWMASVSQDGEGNIALAASATDSTATPVILNPTAIYTGRLAADPANTLPQGEVDALAAVTKGLQLSNTFNRWGDYSSLFTDPADECTFWGAFEYSDSPNASFDWNTRIFSFKVNPTCVTAPRGTINGTITNCGNGTPILNAVISTPEGFFRQSNASGQFSMTVTPGTYTVTVSGPPGSGFGNCTQTVTVAAGGTATVNCCLAPSAIIVSAGATLVSESCAPANGVLDPGETVTVSLCVQNTGGGNTTALMGTLQATGGVTSIQPPNPQNYGVVVAGGPPVCRNFTFTVSGTCGGTVTATLQLADGATNLGSVTYTFNLGVLNTAFTENFDGVTAPALPAGWVSAFTNGDGDCTVGGPLCTLGSNWTTVSSAPVDTAPNALFHDDPSCVTNNTIDTPSINITSTSAQVTFRNNFNLEDTFDGGVLEVSSPNINAGAFTDITNAAVGGSFVTGGYTDTIATSFLSPIAGRQAWSGNSGGYITTTANLGPNVAGQTIKLRFRFASDCSVGATAWRIDTLKVTDGLVCSTDCGNVTPCVVTCPANITVSNDPNQCGAVVTYPAPTSTGDCGTITCTPPSGSFFPVGTTTVTCQASNGGGTVAIGGGKDAAPQGGCANPQTITQSSSQAITALNSVSCNNGIGHTDNSYWRAFTLSSFGINGAFDVQSVDIGVEEASSGGAASSSAPHISKGSKFKSGAPHGGGQPITVRIYTSNQPFPAGFPGSLTLIGTADATVADQSLTIINVPITGTAPAGSELVVEVFTPNGEAAGNLFFIGSNAAPETGPSYLSAPDCGVNTPTTTSAIGFPNMHIVLNVNGCEQVAGGNGPTCTFTVTVNDTQPPVITCPPNLTAVTATVNDPCTVVNFTTTASDNCPGVVVVCTPPSGSCFPVGVTTVTCTATDASGNTATCSFTISVFNGRMQDDFEGCANTVLFNTLTGDYRWCCHGTIYTGRGKVTKLGNTFKIEHNPSDRRVLINLSAGSFPPSGNASLQSPPGTIKCVIQDRDTRNDTCVCGAPLAN